MSRPEPMRRTIEPHALAYDGFRWHARALDRETAEFHDFVLGRVSTPKSGGEDDSKSAADVDWNSFVDLVIARHPELIPA
jgi:predicted DNA-binding transcriptional regulator YafY